MTLQLCDHGRAQLNTGRLVASSLKTSTSREYQCAQGGTCQQLWDTRELHLVSLDYGGETREVGAIDINIDQDLVA